MSPYESTITYRISGCLVSRYESGEQRRQDLSGRNRLPDIFEEFGGSGRSLASAELWLLSHAPSQSFILETVTKLQQQPNKKSQKKI
jgi:hypothetical protein